MVDRNAQNLVLLSRYGPRIPAAYELLEELRSRGVRVEAPACDVTNTLGVKEMFGILKSTMPQIRGCVRVSIDANVGCKIIRVTQVD